MYAHACKVGLEGVISKVRDSAYTSGRGNNWVKKTCAQRETLTIAGFAMKDRKFDGIFVGRQKGESRRLGLLPADDLADGNPGNQITRRRTRYVARGSHAGIEARHGGMNIAKLATDQAKTCGEVFKIGRHGTYTPVRLGCRYCSGHMPCSGCVAGDQSAALSRACGVYADAERTQGRLDLFN